MWRGVTVRKGTVGRSKGGFDASTLLDLTINHAHQKFSYYFKVYDGITIIDPTVIYKYLCTPRATQFDVNTTFSVKINWGKKSRIKM